MQSHTSYIHLLCDFSPHDTIPATHLLTVQKVFANLGIQIAQNKTAGPATSIEFLGININSLLHNSLLHKLDLIMSNLLDSLTYFKHRLLSLLGHLNFSMRIIPQDHPSILHPLSLKSIVLALEEQISPTSSMPRWAKIVDNLPITMEWSHFLLLQSFVSPRWYPAVHWCIPLHRLQGALSRTLVCVSVVPQLLNIQVFSLFGSFQALPPHRHGLAVGERMASNSILVYCDNEAMVHCINKGHSQSIQ